MDKMILTKLVPYGLQSSQFKQDFQYGAKLTPFLPSSLQNHSYKERSNFPCISTDLSDLHEGLSIESSDILFPELYEEKLDKDDYDSFVWSSSLPLGENFDSQVGFEKTIERNAISLNSRFPNETPFDLPSPSFSNEAFEFYDPTVDLSPLYELASEINIGKLEDSILDEDKSLLQAIENGESDSIIHEILKDSDDASIQFSTEPSVDVPDCPTAFESIELDTTFDTFSFGSTSQQSEMLTWEVSSAASPEKCFLESSEIGSIVSPSSDTDYPFSSPSSSSGEYSPLPLDALEISEKGGKKREKMSKETKYLRKKQQNKEAALRYRQKKKKEEQDKLSVLQIEERANGKLKEECLELTQEILFLKKLIKETMIV